MNKRSIIVHCATRENKCFSRVAHDFFSTSGSESGFVCIEIKTIFLFFSIKNVKNIIPLIESNAVVCGSSIAMTSPSGLTI